MQNLPTVDVLLPQMLLNHAQQLGLDSNTICQKAQLDSTLLNQAGARISAAQYTDLLDRVADMSGDNAFGLHYGNQSSLATGNLFVTMMLASPTMGGALQRLFRYHGILADNVVPKLIVEKNSAYIELELKHKISRHQTEAVFARCSSIARLLSNDAGSPIEVSFVHEAPDDVSGHNEVFACPVNFSQPHNKIELPLDSLDLPLPEADSELLESLERLAQKRLNRIGGIGELGRKIQTKITHRLCASEGASIEEVAEELSITVRKLQKILKEEGTTYRSLLDRVRMDLATEHLANTQMPICDIAFLLGYSDQSAFTHAFKRLAGKSPVEYRVESIS